jgi:hypothetical protein
VPRHSLDGTHPRSQTFQRNIFHIGRRLRFRAAETPHGEPDNGTVTANQPATPDIIEKLVRIWSDRKEKQIAVRVQYMTGPAGDCTVYRLRSLLSGE